MSTEPHSSPSVTAFSDNVANRKSTRARIGERLRDHVEDLIAKYVARMRSDPLIPLAKKLPDPILEDHAMSFLGDIIQSLVVIEKAAELDALEESNLMTDGTEIQRLIAELHGRQRHRIGWTESALQREYLILIEEVEALVARQAPDDARNAAIKQGIDLFTRLLARARDASFAGYRAAAGESRN